MNFVRGKNGDTVITEVEYERLPHLCSHCGNVGHNVTDCKVVHKPMASSQVAEEMERGRSRKPKRHRKKTKQIYVPKASDQVNKGKKSVVEPALNAPSVGEGPFASRSPLPVPMETLHIRQHLVATLEEHPITENAMLVAPIVPAGLTI